MHRRSHDNGPVDRLKSSQVPSSNRQQRPIDAATMALLAARDGDPAAFERFAQLTWADVDRFCRYLGDPDHSDDLVQDTYVQALRSFASYRGDAPAGVWLMTIARRVCADAVAARQRRRSIAVFPDLGRVMGMGADWVELKALLHALDLDQRRAFVLTQMLGFGYEETAAICGCPIGTIRSRIARARVALANAIVAADGERSG